MIEFLDGNEAVSRGAVAAGCDFFAGYPITPASSILSALCRLLPLRGGVAVQAEDEIASMGFCIAAAAAGRRAITATSGPGISLYSENLGMAQMMEVPLVVVNVQRQGPATGSATKGADGDVQFTRWVTSGGIEMPTFCPATVEDAYLLTIEAVAASERLRTPVFVLSNKELGMTRRRVDLAALEAPPAPPRERAAAAGGFRPYRFDPPGETVPMAPLGGDLITRYTTSSHDEDGRIDSHPTKVAALIRHLAAKIEKAAPSLERYRWDPQPGADTLVIAYGVTDGAASEAVARARAKGKKVSHLTLLTLWPVAEKILHRAVEGVRRIVVPEMNLGQYLQEIRFRFPDRAVVGVCRMDTLLVPPRDILAVIDPEATS